MMHCRYENYNTCSMTMSHSFYLRHGSHSEDVLKISGVLLTVIQIFMISSFQILYTFPLRCLYIVTALLAFLMMCLLSLYHAKMIRLLHDYLPVMSLRVWSFYWQYLGWFLLVLHVFHIKVISFIQIFFFFSWEDLHSWRFAKMSQIILYNLNVGTMAYTQCGGYWHVTTSDTWKHICRIFKDTYFQMVLLAM